LSQVMAQQDLVDYSDEEAVPFQSFLPANEDE